jgi:hypothetical protein
MTKFRLKNLAIVSSGFLWAGMSQAQVSVNASGRDATGSGGSVSYSIGQVLSSTHADMIGTVGQGVQQPYEIFAVGVMETVGTLSLRVLPNPTTDQITLQINDYKNQKLSYQLFDIQGKLLISEFNAGNQTQIDMSKLPSATYFIHVNQENKKVNSFKIIKN